MTSTNANKNLNTYTRRNKQVERTRSGTNHLSQTSEAAPTSNEWCIGEDKGELENIVSLEVGDLELPIAVRKGVMSSTMHPIRNYVSYDGLSESYRAFVSVIDNNVQVPANTHEVLMHPSRWDWSTWKKWYMDSDRPTYWEMNEWM